MNVSANITPLFDTPENEPIVTDCTLSNEINVIYKHYKEDYIAELALDYGVSTDIAENIITAAFTAARNNIKSYNRDIVTLNEWLDQFIGTEIAKLQSNEFGHNHSENEYEASKEKLNSEIENAITILSKQGITRTQAAQKITECFKDAMSRVETGEETELIDTCQRELKRILNRPKVLHMPYPQTK